MKGHYTEADFMITRQNELGEYGYCRKCTADMQRLYYDKLLIHYRSHQEYRELMKENKRYDRNEKGGE